MLRTFLTLTACLLCCYGFNWFLAESIEEVVVHIVNLCGISIIMAVGLNVTNGLTGQFSLGHAGFMAVGAYAGAYLTTTLSYIDENTLQYVTAAPVFQSSWGFIPAIMIGGSAAALVGVVVGTPTLRLKGDYLAIATLGCGEIIQIVITDLRKVGGAAGLSGIPSMPALPGISATPGASATFWIYSFVSLVVLLSLHLQRSTYGRALIAIRENELAAEMMGIRTARLKVMAFIYGAFFAGIAGALYGHYQLSLRPSDFSFVRSIEVVVMLVLGGLGSLTGAIVGAVSLTILPELLRPVEKQLGVAGIRMVVYSLVLIVLMLFRPQGIFGQRELSLRLLRRLLPGARDKGSP